MSMLPNFETTRSANGRVILAKSERKPASPFPPKPKGDRSDPIHNAIRKT
jgi:hypothetical protein